MASFLVSYGGSTGRPQTLTIKAANPTEAKKLLRRRGIRADELRKVPPKDEKKTSQISDNKNNFSSFNINHLFEKVPGVKERQFSQANFQL